MPVENISFETFMTKLKIFENNKILIVSYGIAYIIRKSSCDKRITNVKIIIIFLNFKLNELLF